MFLLFAFFWLSEVSGSLSLDFLLEEMPGPSCTAITDRPECQLTAQSHTNALRVPSIHHFPEVNVAMPLWFSITLELKCWWNIYFYFCTVARNVALQQEDPRFQSWHEVFLHGVSYCGQLLQS